jgi:transposase InsO family protein
MQASGKKQHPYKCKYCSEKHPPRKCPKAPKCNHCSKKGHDEDKCWLKHPHLKSNKGSSSDKSPPKIEELEDAKFAVAFMANNLQTKQQVSTTFYIDSGCSLHLINDQKLLIDPQPTNYTISTANQDPIKGTLKGKVMIQIGNQVMILQQVIYAPQLTQNLISVGELLKEGYTVEFHKEQCVIGNTRTQQKMKIRAAGNIFKMTGDVIMPSNKAASYYSSVPTTLQNDSAITPYYIHALFGHIGRSKILRLLRNNAVAGISDQFLSYNGIPYCESCIKAKHPKHSFTQSSTKTASPGELLHSDLAGPIIPQSAGKKRYILNIIDDYSKYCFTFLLHRKSDAGEAIISCINHIKTQMNYHVKMFRTDRGGEFLNANLNQYFSTQGIVHQLTAPYTPEQNGVAERYNRTLVETARTFLLSSSLPSTLWGEAVLTSNYILNRVNISASKLKTPYELFHNVKPDISSVKPFGIRCYVKDPQVTSKFQAKSIEGFLVGYEMTSKAWRVFHPASHTIIVSRNVVFLHDSVQSGGEKESNNDFTITEDETEEETNNAITNESANQSQENQPESQSTETHRSKIQKLQDSNRDIYHLRSRTIHASLAEGFQALSKLDTVNESECISDNDHIFELHSIAALSTEARPEEPSTYKEAVQSSFADKWKAAIQDEISSLLENNTWSVVDLPPGRSTIKSKWVFKLKHDSQGQIARFKARLVAKGYSQKEGIDYHETFSPVVKFSSLRLLLALAAKHDWEIEQVDFTTAFLNGNLDEEIFMEIPEGYNNDNYTGKVLKLQKSLYGLKQAPRQWNIALDQNLAKLGFQRLVTDEAIYIKCDHTSFIIITIYVDDMLIFGTSPQLINQFINDMNSKFKLKRLGPVNYIIGIKVERDRVKKTISLSQRQYIINMANRFNISESSNVNTPMDPSFHSKLHDGDHVDVPYSEAIGSLIYAMLGTRPDIAFSVGYLCRFMSRPTMEHWMALRRVLSYLITTKDLTLQYGPIDHGGINDIVGYSDADFASNPQDRKSTTGYLITYYNGAISWISKRQHRVARSTTEAEYIALSSAAAETIWLRNLLIEISKFHDSNVIIACKDSVKGLDHPKDKDTNTKSALVYGDNTASIQLARNPKFHNRTKHFDIDYHWIREQVKLGKITLTYLPTNKMLADGLTKPLGRIKLEQFISASGLKNNSIRGSVEKD